MVKFSADGGDGKILGLGISERNVQLLREGKPILIRSDELEQLTSWKGSIMLFYGKTEDDIKKTLTKFIGPRTRVKEPPK